MVWGGEASMCFVLIYVSDWISIWNVSFGWEQMPPFIEFSSLISLNTQAFQVMLCLFRTVVFLRPFSLFSNSLLMLREN